MAKRPFQKFGSVCWFRQRASSVEFVREVLAYMLMDFVIYLKINSPVHKNTLHGMRNWALFDQCKRKFIKLGMHFCNH